MLHLPDYFITRFGRRLSFFFTNPPSKSLFKRLFFTFLGFTFFLILASIPLYRYDSSVDANISASGVGALISYTNGSIIQNIFYAGIFGSILVQYSGSLFGVDPQFSPSQLHQKFYRRGLQFISNMVVVIYTTFTHQLLPGASVLERLINLVLLSLGSLVLIMVEDIFQNLGFLNLLSAIMIFVYMDTLFRSLFFDSQSFFINTIDFIQGELSAWDYLWGVRNNLTCCLLTTVLFFLYTRLEFGYYNFILRSTRVRGAVQRFPIDFFIASTTPIFMFSMGMNFVDMILTNLASSEIIPFFNHIFHKDPLTGEMSGFLSFFIPISTSSLGRVLYWLQITPFLFILRLLVSTLTSWLIFRILVRNFRAISGMSIENFTQLLSERSLYIPEFQDRSEKLVEKRINKFFNSLDIGNVIFFTVGVSLTSLIGTLGGVQVIGIAIIFGTIKNLLQQASKDIPEFPTH